MNGMPAALQRACPTVLPSPPFSWSAMLASVMALASGVSGAPCSNPHPLVWSKEGCPGRPRTMSRFQWPFRLGYLEKSTIWAPAVEPDRAANAIAHNKLRQSMSILPVRVSSRPKYKTAGDKTVRGSDQVHASGVIAVAMLLATGSQAGAG